MEANHVFLVYCLTFSAAVFIIFKNNWGTMIGEMTNG